MTDHGLRLAGRVALVTGASRGIGAAAAAALSRQGASVALSCLPEPAMAAAAEALRDSIIAAGGHAVVVPADLRDDAALAMAVQVTVDHFGGLDVLIANGSRSQSGHPDDATAAVWDDVMAVNVRSTWLLVRHAMPWLTRRAGCVVTVSSVLGLLGDPTATAYATSKAATIGLTRSLARELGPSGIRVNCVIPGAIKTEHEVELHGSNQELDQRILNNQVLPRRGTADDVAGALVFLASCDALFITGQSLVVDGGWVMP